MTIAIILLSVAALVIWQKLDDTNPYADKPEDKWQRRERYQQQAAIALDQSITNTTGWRRTLSKFVFSGDESLRTWSATSDYEIINERGGVEKRTGWYIFKDSMRSVSAYQVTLAEYEQLTKK